MFTPHDYLTTAAQLGLSCPLKEAMHAFRQSHPHADSYHFACRCLLLSNYRALCAWQSYVSHQVNSSSHISEVLHGMLDLSTSGINLMIQHCMLPLSSTKYVQSGI